MDLTLRNVKLAAKPTDTVDIGMSGFMSPLPTLREPG